LGNIVSTTGSSENNRLANTKERDSSIALDNHGMRYYDPQVGTYSGRDPVGLQSGMNTYRHVGANPVNRNDPLGLGPEDGKDESSRPEVKPGYYVDPDGGVHRIRPGVDVPSGYRAATVEEYRAHVRRQAQLRKEQGGVIKHEGALPEVPGPTDAIIKATGEQTQGAGTGRPTLEEESWDIGGGMRLVKPWSTRGLETLKKEGPEVSLYVAEATLMGYTLFGAAGATGVTKTVVSKFMMASARRQAGKVVAGHVARVALSADDVGRFAHLLGEFTEGSSSSGAAVMRAMSQTPAGREALVKVMHQASYALQQGPGAFTHPKAAQACWTIQKLAGTLAKAGH
jgi:RHS repeat-associated protein